MVSAPDVANDEKVKSLCSIFPTLPPAVVCANLRGNAWDVAAAADALLNCKLSPPSALERRSTKGRAAQIHTQVFIRISPTDTLLPA